VAGVLLLYRTQTTTVKGDKTTAGAVRSCLEHRRRRSTNVRKREKKTKHKQRRSSNVGQRETRSTRDTSGEARRTSDKRRRNPSQGYYSSLRHKQRRSTNVRKRKRCGKGKSRLWNTNSNARRTSDRGRDVADKRRRNPITGVLLQPETRTSEKGRDLSSPRRRCKLPPDRGNNPNEF
jgi:hypothetical protein